MNVLDIFSGLNAEQRSAVESTAPQILCVAGAGTGKTYCMISRINKLVNIDKVNPQSILALTFTNAAAFEMEGRFTKYNPDCTTRPQFRTFHSFCYHLLSIDYSVLNALRYTQVPNIIDDAGFKQLQEGVRLRLGIKTSCRKLANANLCKDAKELADYKVFNTAVASKLIRDNVITFDLLCSEVCKLFVIDAPCIIKYKNQFKYVFVDEFQDTDRCQYDFLMSFTDSYKFVVGDPLQALYGFRGADSSLIKQLITDPAWAVIKLHQNYRSTQQICDFANAIDTGIDRRFRVNLESGTQKQGDEVFEKRDFGLDSIIRSKLDTLPGSTAILCRTNSEVVTMCKWLDDSNIPYATKDNDKISVNIWRSVNDNQYFMQWLASLLTSERYCDYIRYFDMRGKTREVTDEVIAEFRTRYNNFIISSYADKVYRIREVLNSAAVWADKLSAILAELALECPEDAIAVIPDDSAVLNYLDNLTKANSSLYVGTIHSVKGLEYDNVIVCGVGSYSFRLDCEEEWNVYYVAVTRARNNLIICKAD